MVVIKRVSAKSILDSRREKTIFVSINTDVGKFSASSPTGKSTGKHEAKPYRKSLEKDIEALKKFTDYFSDEIIDDFFDLRRIEDIVEGLGIMAYLLGAVVCLSFVFSWFDDIRTSMVIGGIIILVFYGSIKTAEQKRLNKERKKVKKKTR